MRFSSKSEVAFIILATLAQQPDKWVKTVDLCKTHDLSRAYVETVCSELRNAGFVVAKKGVGGGYQLAKPATDLMLKDILTPFTRIKGVFEPTHPALTRLYQQFNDVLAATSLAKVAV